MKDEINLVKILEIILKLWWFVLIFAIIAGVIAFSISSFLMTPLYTSTAKVYVSGSQTNAGAGTNYSELTTNTRLVSTYIEILCSDTYLNQVAGQSEEYKISGSSIKSKITMNSANETEILEIKYADISPERARDILQLVLNNAQGEITRIMPGCIVSIVDNASLPTTTSSPNVKQNTFIGIFAGIIIGIAIIFIKELLDTRIKDEDDLKSKYNIPVLGIIPNLDVD
ncbi:MAG: hypothetical protein IKJ68_01630 [Clostridia bacterium]|nr:hypothetical protein [Clostridia bacterium]